MHRGSYDLPRIIINLNKPRPSDRSPPSIEIWIQLLSSTILCHLPFLPRVEPVQFSWHFYNPIVKPHTYVVCFCMVGVIISFLQRLVENAADFFFVFFFKAGDNAKSRLHLQNTVIVGDVAPIIPCIIIGDNWVHNSNLISSRDGATDKSEKPFLADDKRQKKKSSDDSWDKLTAFRFDVFKNCPLARPTAC